MMTLFELRDGIPGQVAHLRRCLQHERNKRVRHTAERGCNNDGWRARAFCDELRGASYSRRVGQSRSTEFVDRNGVALLLLVHPVSQQVSAPDSRKKASSDEVVAVSFSMCVPPFRERMGGRAHIGNG